LLIADFVAKRCELCQVFHRKRSQRDLPLSADNGFDPNRAESSYFEKVSIWHPFCLMAIG